MNEEEDIGWVEIGPFVSKTLDQQEARRNAERAMPRVSDNVEKTFTSAPIRTLESSPPLGRRSTVNATTESVASSSAAGAFYTMVTIVGGADDGDIVLQGGQVLGGNND